MTSFLDTSPTHDGGFNPGAAFDALGAAREASVGRRLDWLDGDAPEISALEEFVEDQRVEGDEAPHNRHSITVLLAKLQREMAQQPDAPEIPEAGQAEPDPTESDIESLRRLIEMAEQPVAPVADTPSAELNAPIEFDAPAELDAPAEIEALSEAEAAFEDKQPAEVASPAGPLHSPWSEPAAPHRLVGAGPAFRSEPLDPGQ